MKNLLNLLIITLLSFGTAYANDDELYDPAPPADSAFVRVVNAASGVAEAPARVGSFDFGVQAYPKISSYHIIKKGEYDVTIGGVAEKMTIDAGAYYTIALTDDLKLVKLQDTLLTNPAKALVYFYNFSAAPIAALIATDHGKPIFADIASGAGDSREVNALKLNLQAKAGDVAVNDYKDVQLKRRVGTSFIVTGKAGGFKSLMVENEVKR